MKLNTTPTSGLTPISRRQERPSLVIIDSGSTASLLVLSDPPPRVGVRFTHLGATWEITHRRRHSKAYVARPALSS